MITRSGEIKFEASMPAFEEVAAKNNSVSALLDLETGKLAVLALIKAFKFKIPLMEEHFNENYLDSNQYPKSTFKGTVLNFDIEKLSATKTIFDVEGELSIHGTTKKIKSKISFINSNGNLNAMSSFKINVSEFGIKIPSLVKNKISETVIIDMKLNLVKK